MATGAAASVAMARTGRLPNGFRVWDDRQADATYEIDVYGHRVVAYSYGQGDDVLYGLNGGPGLPCDYLRDALVPLAGHGSETVAMMQAFEAAGAYDHPAYAAAVELLDFRHIRRLPERPLPVQRSTAGFNRPIYMTIQGPNEYHYVGSIMDWDRIADLGRLQQPALVVNGRHDVITPACGMRLAQALPHAETAIMPNSSHSPFYEEPEAYRALLLDFLGRQRGRA